MKAVACLGAAAAAVLFLLACCTGNAAAPPSREVLRRYVAARELYCERRFGEALSLLELNRSEAPSFTGNSFLIGKIHFHRQDYAAARRAWEEALARNPHHLDSRKWLARLHLLQGRAAPARQLVEEALADSAEDPELLVLLGRALRQQGDLAAAIEALRKAQVLAERSAEAALELAEIYNGMGLEDRVQDQLQRAAALLGGPAP